MKNYTSKFATISILAAALTITSPATALDRFDVDAVKPYLIGGAVVAAASLAGWYLFGGKEKSDTLTKVKLDEAITPLREEIDALKRQLSEAQRTETLLLIKANMKDEEFLEFLRQQLLPANTQPNGGLQALTRPDNPLTPHRKPSTGIQDYIPSPVKRLDDAERRAALSKHQESVRWALEKEFLSERIWKLLEQDNGAATAVSLEINNPDNQNATFFDYTFKNQSSCKMVITIDGKPTEKRISLSK